MGHDVEFRVLGSLDVEIRGRVVTPRSRQLRKILAVLLVDADQVVSSDRLVEVLWGDDAAPNAHSRVGKLIYRLRAALPTEARAVIETISPGYVIHVGHHCDAACFETQLADAHTHLADGGGVAAIESLDRCLLYTSPSPRDS